VILLTHSDYYRRFDVVIERLKAEPSLAVVSVENTAKLRPPDAYNAGSALFSTSPGRLLL
jgi:hypothetical protein